MTENETSALTEWFQLFDKFGALGERIYLKRQDVYGRSHDPKIIGTIIFHRIWGHFRSFNLLWRNRLSLDADVVLRNCCEAAICLANLSERPHDFMKALRSDAASTLAGQIRMWRKIPDADELVRQGEAQLREIFGEKGEDGRRHSQLNLETLASEASVLPLYHYYRSASGAGAHITGLSLLFHMAEGDEAADKRLADRREKGREQSLAHMCIVMGVSLVAFCRLQNMGEAEEALALAIEGSEIGKRFDFDDELD